MHPIFCKGYAVAALALRNLVFVVGKNEILTAAVNVYSFSEIASDHGGAFNVPAGSSVSPRGSPVRLAGLGCFPKGKIHRILFDLSDVDSCAGLKLLKRLMRKLSVFLEFFGAEIYVAVHGISKAFFNKRRNYADNFADILGSLGMNGCLTDIQTLCIDPEFLNVFFGDILVSHALLVGTANNLIVDIGKVLNKGDLVAHVFEIAAKNIKNAKRPCIADVDIVIHCRAAGINFEFTLVNRHKLLLFPCQSVKNFHFESFLSVILSSLFLFISCFSSFSSLSILQWSAQSS